MYVKIEPHAYNLIDLLFVLKSSSAYYFEGDEVFNNHRTAYNLLKIIEEDDKYSFVDLISDEIEFLSEEALKKQYDNTDIISLINILTVYLSIVRYRSTLEEMLCESKYLFVKQLKIADYDYSERGELEDEKKDLFQDPEAEGKDFFEDDFDFGDNEEPPEIYERPSEVDEADIIRKPKSI